jgi:hypothetical protein
MRQTMRNKPRLKTKADLAQYAADLEVELAYNERDIAELKEQIAELLAMLEEATRPDTQETYEITVTVSHDVFPIPHPGYIC